MEATMIDSMLQSFQDPHSRHALLVPERVGGAAPIVATQRSGQTNAAASR